MESWQAMNALSHIAAYLGNKMEGSFGTGDFFETEDGARYPRNSQFPIIVLQGKPEDMPDLLKSARESGLRHLAFIREMIETNDDEEIVGILKHKKDADVECLGIGIFGNNEEVKALTKRFSLWK